jgi:hypothetical protein
MEDTPGRLAQTAKGAHDYARRHDYMLLSLVAYTCSVTVQRRLYFKIWLTIPAHFQKQIYAQHDSILLLRLVTMISHRQLWFSSRILVRRPSL